jgi:hypothetical protein
MPVQSPDDSWADELLQVLLRPSIPEPLGDVGADAGDGEASEKEAVSST